MGEEIFLKADTVADLDRYLEAEKLTIEDLIVIRSWAVAAIQGFYGSTISNSPYWEEASLDKSWKGFTSVSFGDQRKMTFKKSDESIEVVDLYIKVRS